MFRAVLPKANFGLLTSIFLFFLPSPPTYADTLLVGTSLVSPIPGPELCPAVAACNNRFSQFSTPEPFVVYDVKVDISGPSPGFSSTDGTFHVSIITNPGSSQTVVANIGSGSLPLDSGFKDQVFDFSGLSTVLSPGIEYYLEVTGGNLMWDSDTPLSGFGTLGLQLSCDPALTCAAGIGSYDHFPGTYAEQISGSAVPEPSTWLLFATGLFLFAGLVYLNSGRKHLSLN